MINQVNKGLLFQDCRMEKIFIKTIPYLEEFLVDDVKSIIKIKPKKIDNELYELNINFEDVFNTVYSLVNLSRTIDKIYMKEIKTKIGEYSFLKDTIKINNKEIEVYDLTSYILQSRKYLLHSNSDTLHHNLINYCSFKLGLDKKKKYSIMDPVSNYSEIIIEIAAFNPRKPLYVNERYEMQIYENFKKIIKKIPSFEKTKDSNKYISVVQSDKAFKRSKENLSKSSLKIKMSKIDLEWIDLKYEEKSIDYIISLFPIYKSKKEYEKFLKEYFTQAKYLAKEKVCVISREEINKRYFSSNKLKLEFENIIELDSIKYYIYILK